MTNYNDFDTESQEILNNLQQDNNSLSFESLNKDFPNNAPFFSKPLKTFDDISRERAENSFFRTKSIFHPNFDNKIKIEVEKRFEEKKIELRGYWSRDKEGKNKINKANLGELVYFQLITTSLKDNTKLILQLQENDGYFLKPDTKFQNATQEKEINKTIFIKNNKATISLYLDEQWDEMIKNDLGAEIEFEPKIELEWKAFSDQFQKKVISNEFIVGYSKRHLFLKPAYKNYSLPELLTKDGETIIFSISDFAKEEVKKQIIATAGNLAENYRYNLATRVLKSGKIATNIVEVYERKKAIYTYNVFTNEGKEVTLKQASNFGFKNKHVNNGKLVTSKGISQIDYFSNIGLKNKVLKTATEITQIWDIIDLAKVFFQDDFSEIPLGYLGNPVSFAYALLNETVIKPTIIGIKDDWNKGLEEDFETIYKPKGLNACKAFVDNTQIKTGFDYLDILTPTLKKLLKNEFLNINEMIKYDGNIQENEHIKAGNKFITHTVFYKAEKNKYGLNDDVYINSIFINNNLLK